ncbi:Universal stress protein [Stieleria maiorica]|uniref:Universal stress protein n=1 Tax=Stieleria maiorica TaxID=2795974 RepID=A0A5B9MF18_9BACT|nr:universal stress protein [Stieleria maiorica]QEF97767.1 Universal stress protein [Stieleria maiorica]
MSTVTSKPIQRILFPTDFSPVANAAFGHAERLAASTGARLIVLHVQQGLATVGPINDVDRETIRQLRAVRPRHRNLDVSRLVYAGSPGETICWIAQEAQCDQIVMGTHGRTGLINLLMGSVAEHVVRHARCPVLTVPTRARNESPLPDPAIELRMPHAQPL